MFTLPRLTSPPGLFAIISLLMIGAMVIGTGLVQATFFRQSMIEREAAIVRDMVFALTVEQPVSAADLRPDMDETVRARLDRVFDALENLPGTARIKVFNRDRIIVWSDDPALVGTNRTRHGEQISRAFQGDVQAVFNPAETRFDASRQGQPTEGTIECYVPIFSHDPARPPGDVIGVLSLYRDPHDLNRTLRQGLYLLWATLGGGGLLLFLVLYKVFSLVYHRQQAAESSLSKLTSEHERIVQIEKMSAMGELVGEIAHQLNNPLVGVINLAQLAEREVHDPARVAELLQDVRKAGAECRDIVQRILRINQLSRSTLQSTDLQALVRDTITFCHQSIGQRQAIEFSAPDAAMVLDVDPVLLRQALFNLIHNAMLAAPGSPVQVTLAPVDRDGAPGLQIGVTDAGPGFSPDAADKLFKPFFTTRATGTGLGLYVAQHIAMKHGGVILAENLAQGGARFSIWLPRKDPS